MSDSVDRTIEKFKKGESKQGEFGKSCRYARCSVFYDNNCLYSFGYHYILAVCLNDKRTLFLKNGDRYSVTTSKHIGACSHLNGGVVSFSALKGAGIEPSSLRERNIVDYSDGNHVWLAREVFTDSEGKKKYGEWKRTNGKYYTPKQLESLPVFKYTQGMVTPYKHTNTIEGREMQEGSYHLLGGVVIKVKKWKSNRNYERVYSKRYSYYLCSIDEQNYFVAELPKDVETLTEAFEVLKPDEVREAEAQGIEVKRQGEWFFIPTDIDKTNCKEFTGLSWSKFKSIKSQPLENSNGSNFHWLKHIKNNGTIYGIGKVYHRDGTGNLTGEHKSVNLYDTIHRVYRNTEKSSFVTGGLFD